MAQKMDKLNTGLDTHKLTAKMRNMEWWYASPDTTPEQLYESYFIILIMKMYCASE